ncbi:MAG: PstS family phosphate ABC transporter substrate-binding protein [Alphaproteobacteria bacterium]
MIRRTLVLTALAGLALATATAPAAARNQIRIVGSSTVYPFATAVAEEFGKSSGFKTPVVESTGTGGGLKLFCSGVGVEHPDISNASRRIKKSEVDACAKNGANQIAEVKIGYDGIVFSNSIKAQPIPLTREQIYLAIAKQVPQKGKLVANPYKTWNEIDPSLPKQEIIVYGPAPNHGTRDALVELVMDEACKKFTEISSLEEAAQKKACETVREDGAFVEVSESYNVTLEKLVKNPTAIGIFGFSYFDNNRDKVRAATVDGVEPTFENISSQKYPVSRSLYFYVKIAHVGAIPGIKEYVDEFTSEKAWGPNGYLAEKGLIPLPDAERKIQREIAMKLTPLTM